MAEAPSGTAAKDTDNNAAEGAEVACRGGGSALRVGDEEGAGHVGVPHGECVDDTSAVGAGFLGVCGPVAACRAHAAEPQIGRAPRPWKDGGCQAASGPLWPVAQFPAPLSGRCHRLPFTWPGSSPMT